MTTSISTAADSLSGSLNWNGTPVVTVDGNGATVPDYPVVTAARSMIRLNTANGYGSTNTKIRRFTNIVTNQGTDITYADSATLGASFTINTDGVYAISYTDNMNAITTSGASLNTTQPTVAISSITQSGVVAITTHSASGIAASSSATVYLATGDVIRPHTDGAASSGVLQFFTITRVS